MLNSLDGFQGFFLEIILDLSVDTGAGAPPPTRFQFNF